MKRIQNIGLVIFLIGLSLFTGTIFTGSFHLSPSALDAFIMEKGYQNEIIKTELTKAFVTDDPLTIFEFSDRVRHAYEVANNHYDLLIAQYDAEKNWDKKGKQYQYKIDIVLHATDIETIQSIKNYNVNIIFQKNFGYGDAIIEGINNCNTDYFCIFNADGSFNPAEIDNMFKSMQNRELDFIFASRYQIGSGSEDDTIITLIGNYIFTYIGKIFFHLKT